MDIHWDDDELSVDLPAISQRIARAKRARSKKKRNVKQSLSELAQQFAVELEDRSFWERLHHIEQAANQLHALDDAFVRLQAVNSATGESWEFPPVRLRPMALKKKRGN